MIKDIEWLKEKIITLIEIDVDNWKRAEPNSSIQSHFGGCLATYDKMMDFIDEMEVEVLTPEWISNNTHYSTDYDDSGNIIRIEAVPVEHLQEILVPKKEELEEEPKYTIKVSENLYLAEPLGDTSGSRIEVTRDKEDAYRFKNIKSIETHLDKFPGAEVEEDER